MYKIHEILIPVRFCTLMMQLILTIVIGFTKNENIYAVIPANSSLESSAFSSANSSYTIIKLKGLHFVLFCFMFSRELK